MKVFAGYAHRYEPGWLIDQLHENLSWVDGFAVYDDSGSSYAWTPADIRNRIVQQKAADAGADWLLFTAPDERWAPDTEPALKEAIGKWPDRRMAFPLRELWTPTQYRVDGIWGRKYRVRAYRLDMLNRRTPVQHLKPAVYHLKMVEPENRVRRVEVFNAHNTWDNRQRGFDYLKDERGLMLADIADTEMFSPAYQKYEFTGPAE